MLKKKERGITLIALVITIIILMILATVSINVVSGEGGLIYRAQEAKRLTEQAEQEEKKTINSIIEKYTNIMTGDTSQKDTTSPTVNIEVGTITESSIQIIVNAQDDESGLATKGTYKYYINNELKATLEENSYTFSGLNAGTTYAIKVVVTDNAGNEAPKEESIKTDEGIVLKEFEIEGLDTYQYEDGMTWYEWVNSEYNTLYLSCGGQDAIVTTGNMKVRLNGKNVVGKDLIIEGTCYEWVMDR